MTSDPSAPRLESLIGQTRTCIEALQGELDDLQEVIRERDAAREAYRAVVENSLQGLLIHQDGEVVFANRALAAMVGLARDQLVGMSADELFKLVHREDHDRVRFYYDARRVGEQAPSDYVLRIERPDGDQRWLEAHVTTSEYLGRPAVHATYIDVTDKKKAEADKRALAERLEQLQRLEALGRLAGGVAHDFNNLLTHVLGTATMALGSAAEGTEVHAALVDIVQSVERGARMTRHLLAFGKRQELSVQTLSLNAAVSHLAETLRRIIGEQIELVIELDEDPCAISADAGRLEQVILNLVVNAREAINHAGRISISTARTSFIAEGPPDVTGEIAAGDYAVLRVADDGHGIPEDALPHIFEPFFSTRPADQGTGLGLSIVYGIVQQHEGQLRVSSQPGQGTVFEVYFPACDHAVAEVEPTFIPDSGEGINATALCVEDEAIVRRVLLEMLEREGLEVLTASSAEEALSLLQADPPHIDVLITDLVMPGISGQGLAGAIREIIPGLKVLFISGYTELHLAPDVLSDGDSAFLSKPFGRRQLAAALEQLLYV